MSKDLSTKDQELGSLMAETEKEAGVADLMELYEKIDRVYSRAAAAAYQSESAHTSDSTSQATVQQ